MAKDKHKLIQKYVNAVLKVPVPKEDNSSLSLTTLSIKLQMHKRIQEIKRNK